MTTYRKREFASLKDALKNIDKNTSKIVKIYRKFDKLQKKKFHLNPKQRYTLNKDKLIQNLRQNQRKLNKESRQIKKILLRYDTMQPKFHKNKFLQEEINKEIFKLEEEEKMNFMKRQENQTALDIHIETKIYGPIIITID